MASDYVDMKASGGDAMEAPMNDYPYGLCLSLNEDSLEKLGLKDERPGAGDELHFAAVAYVRSARADEAGGLSCIDLQITHMQVIEHETADEEAGESAAVENAEDK